MNPTNFNFNNFLTQAQAPIAPIEFVFMLLLTALTAYVVKGVYVRYGSAISNRKGFGSIFIPLAMTTMIIITVVKSSLALSLGLVGALSIVRFRAAIKEPEELVYLFICISIGLGYGANQITITILGVLILILILALTNHKASNDDLGNVMYLTLTKQTQEDINLEEIINLIEKNSLEVDLKRLDDSSSTKEVSFILSFGDRSNVVALRNDLQSFDKDLQITFLDNTKIF
jgi:hypothetical protein